MKKRLLALFLMLAVIFTFTGCDLPVIGDLLQKKLPQTGIAQPTSAPAETASATETETTTAAIEETTTTAPAPVLKPVEEDVFYFSNGLEYERLYSMRHDGSDLTLILDEAAYSVQQEGDTVYFTDRDSCLIGYHIPTGERRILVDHLVQMFSIDGKNLVYATPHKNENGANEAFSSDIVHRDLSTGEEYIVCTTEPSMISMGNGFFYYTTYDPDTWETNLIGYDLAGRESRVLFESPHGLGSYFPTNGGLYFVQYGDPGHWFFAAADGSSVQQLDDILDVDATLLDISEDGFLYTMSYNYMTETPGGIYQMAQDGTVRTLFAAKGSEHYMAHRLPGGCWLFHSADYVGWGEKDEWDNYTNYYANHTYLLMDQSHKFHTLSVGDVTAQLFADGDFPLLDSSTARKPVTAALYNLFVMNHGYEGKAPICSTTHGAWLNIADRKVDMALLAAPTPEEQAYLDEKGVEIEMKLYGGDGLVFIGNAANPVDNLTHEQVLAIYRGEITNWKELGGPDHEITVYYRDDQSGSQRLFESLVFKGEELPDYEGLHFAIMDDMSSIVNIVIEEPWAIGYSIMTYLEDVYSNENLKAFAVNGALPSAETVKDKSYPYNTRGYLVIRKDEPQDSPARRLFNWFGTSMSDDLLTHNSITPLHDDPVSPTTD